MLCACAWAGAARADGDGGTHYEIGGYIWASSLASKVDTAQGESDTHISFSQLFDHLSGGLQARARGDWDDWSAVFDGTWAKLRVPKQSQNVRVGPPVLGVQAGAEVSTSVNEYIFELNGGHRLFTFGSPFSNSPSDKRKLRGELYGGVRYWSVDPKITVDLSGPVHGARTFRLGDRTEWVDPVVGLRFAADLSSTVVFRIAGDVGGFNLGNYCSDFTWEQVTTLSWRFSESWSTHFGYKFLDYRRDAGDSNQRMQMRGPFIALSYGF
ncbi:MAG TPA: hypothetical protein VMR86_05140 [Myxococcota bacterium]|nr:hypothetical protein [Myxococcota bacterium]